MLVTNMYSEFGCHTQLKSYSYLMFTILGLCVHSPHVGVSAGVGTIAHESRCVAILEGNAFRQCQMNIKNVFSKKSISSVLFTCLFVYLRHRYK